MKYLHEYRQPHAVAQLVEKIHAIATQSWTLMEICGGQTQSIAKYGLQQMLPETISLVHGPGCPVCVTPIGVIDSVIELASRPGVIVCSFGDMLRVPGSKSDLLAAKTHGADVRIVYSPLDALRLAEQNRDRQVIFLAIGFETTAAANAMAAYLARKNDLQNFSMLVSQFQVPPAVEALCASPQCQVQALLAAGHVCTVMGYHQYPPLSARYRIPIVVTGFEPVDILGGIYCAIRQLERGEAFVENRYERAVTEAGNIPAQRLISEVFEPSRQEWRGIGMIEHSGYKLRSPYSRFDAAVKFGIGDTPTPTDADECIAGAIMLGQKKPFDCPHFGSRCRPESPVGAPMVSTEGVCSAYYRFTKGPHA